jgi:phenylalanyl-tRNA synthetase alpha chain
MSTRTLTADLALRDLTDPYAGPHALQQMIAEILAAVSARHPADHLVLDRGHRVVDIADNYDHLGYTATARTRDARHTRYVDDTRMLRSQTSALIPPVLRRLATANRHTALIACPGLVYRRDVIDRLHTGTPHQLDLWRLSTTPDALGPLIDTVVGAALPGVTWRANPASHPYTSHGLEIEADVDGRWVEIAECGHAARSVLTAAGLPATVTGLAMGLGLDRLVMLRKGMPDIRLLRSEDPRVATQMLDLSPYRAVSSHPPATRDLSIAIPSGTTPEEIGDRVRSSLGTDADLIEEVTVLSATAISELPAAARDRLDIQPGETNVLLRVTLRDLAGSIPVPAANALRDRIHAALHHAKPSDPEQAASNSAHPATRPGLLVTVAPNSVRDQETQRSRPPRQR